MLYYVFYLIAAVNFAAFLVTLILLAKELIISARYRKIEEYLQNLEIKNLKDEMLAS